MYRKGKWSVNCGVGYFISFEITKYIEYELKIKLCFIKIEIEN